MELQKFWEESDLHDAAVCWYLGRMVYKRTDMGNDGRGKCGTCNAGKVENKNNDYDGKAQSWHVVQQADV